jgi:hypothetical protein
LPGVDWLSTHARQRQDRLDRTTVMVNNNYSQFMFEQKSKCRNRRNLRDRQALLAPADWIDGARGWTTILRVAANSILNRIVSPS